MHTAFVYILECADGSYYVGSHRGTAIEERVGEHQHGKYRDAYTFTRRPVKLVWSDWFPRFDDAVLFERQIKGWSRAKKEALIRGEFNALQFLAKRPNARRKITDCETASEPLNPHPEVRPQGASKDDHGFRASGHPSRRASLAPQDEGK